MGRKKCQRKGLQKNHKRQDRNGKTLKTEEKNASDGFATEDDAVVRKEKVTGPIDVYSRLKYPFVESIASEDEEEDVYFDFKPRYVFACNLCLICMEVSRVVCDRCGMVSFCARHREEGWTKHRDLCAALMEIGKTSMKEIRRTAHEYRVYRLKLIEILESRIGRPLDLWEKEIVLYPRVCRGCRGFSSDRENPSCCPVCEMEFFCQEHKTDHERWCQEFLVYRVCLSMQWRHGYVVPQIPNVRNWCLTWSLASASPSSFDELLFRVYANGTAAQNRRFLKMDSYTYATVSQVCTVPLTALHSMQISCPDWRNRSELTVHVVGAEFQFEGVNLRLWEKVFLHFLPNLKTLRLTLLGPELRLPDGVEKLLSQVRLCSDCESRGRTISVLFRPATLYHDFARAQPLAVRPDLVCLFNPGLYRSTGFGGKDTWPETIREFTRTRVPVIVTSYTEDEMPRELDRIKSLSNVEVILEPRRNPFASVKPDRNFVSDDTAPLIYKNYYITIVKGI